jgi:thioredoxin-related protein
MRKLIVILLLLGSFIFANELKWEKDIPTAFSKAIKENKTVMVFASSNHCQWCKKMTKHTLLDDKIFKKLENYILVKTLKDSKEAQKYLPEVQYVPTIFFYSPKKELYERVTGYFGVFDFLSWINDVEQRKILKIEKKKK